MERSDRSKDQKTHSNGGRCICPIPPPRLF
jgi:hypothetical protein